MRAVLVRPSLHFVKYLTAQPRPSRVIALQAHPTNSNAMSLEAQIVDLNQKLFDAILANDYTTYVELCAEDLTCFEPEAERNLVVGLGFHEFYFKCAAKNATAPGTGLVARVTMANPRVRILKGGEAALFTCTRLVQKEGQAKVSSFEETRIWEKGPKGWQCVHFHKS